MNKIVRSALKIGIALCVAVFIFVSMKIVQGLNSMLGISHAKPQTTPMGTLVVYADTPTASYGEGCACEASGSSC